jgi:hypothetical protein
MFTRRRGRAPARAAGGGAVTGWARPSNRAVSTATLGALVALAAYSGHVPAVTSRLPAQWTALPVIVVAGLLALAVAIGWPSLLALPARSGATVVMILGGVGGVLAVTYSRGEPFLRALPLVFAFAILLAFVNELIRPGPRGHVVESLSGVVSGVIVAASAAAWIAAQRTAGGIGLVVAGAVALAIASAVSAIGLRGWLRSIATIVVAAGAAGTIAYLAPPDVRWLAGTVIGLAVGIVIASLDALFDRLPALEGRLAGLAAVALPVSLSGVFVYIIGRVLVG